LSTGTCLTSRRNCVRRKVCRCRFYFSNLDAVCFEYRYVSKVVFIFLTLTLCALSTGTCLKLRRNCVKWLTWNSPKTTKPGRRKVV